ncbi:MAG: hypothetical protein ABSC54_02590 [Smithellaceae bacterium]|jgi:hypothetical protein
MRKWQFFVSPLFLLLCFITNSLAREYTGKTGDSLKNISKKSGISSPDRFLPVDYPAGLLYEFISISYLICLRLRLNSVATLDK